VADKAEGSAFRTFAIEPPYQVRNIRKMCEVRIADLGKQIADGYAKDFPDYKERVGVVAGLREALAFCDEMEKAEKQ
jgi:hypothetical protein